MFHQYVAEQLAERERSGLLRKTQLVNPKSARLIEVEGSHYLNFATNDYLGLAADSNQILSSAKTSLFSGAMASPLVTGYHQIHRDLEQQLLQLVKAPIDFGCLLFSSGFAANMGVIKALFNSSRGNALLIQDKLNHASLLESGSNSQGQGYCKQWRFKHNDNSSLEQLLTAKNAHETRCLTVTEGIFSMDGDAPDLSGLSQVARRAGSLVMVDDAHGIGVLGPHGIGSLAEQNLSFSDIDILVVTFGKGVGAQGAAVIAPQLYIDYFTNYSKEFIYSTHLSPMQTYLVSENLKKMVSEDWRREKLHSNIAYFKTKMKNANRTVMPSGSAIQPIWIGDEKVALSVSEQLKQKGIWLTAIRYPTVAKGAARLRLTLTTDHTHDDIDFLVKSLVECTYD